MRVIPLSNDCPKERRVEAFERKERYKFNQSTKLHSLFEGGLG